MPKSRAARSLPAALPLVQGSPPREAGPGRIRKQLREREKEVVSLRARLRAERMRLSLIVSSLVAGVVLTDCRGKVLLINRSARRMMGLPEDGRVGSHRPGSPL